MGDDPVTNQETIPEESRSILLGIIAQLTKGMDLHRVTLPTFVLEPRSFLERITDFMSHPDLLLNISDAQEPEDRFVAIVLYFLSGWHIQPKGVKKPYNPTLGEFFRATWTQPDGSRAIFVSEQVSHHPPVSAYFYACPKHHVRITGEIFPKSKFLGNSAATLMQGWNHVEFTNLPGEVYDIQLPNIYARGILFGTMTMELGDTAVIKCPKTGLMCEVEFKTKGFFSGTYNAILGKIKRIGGSGDTLYDISGKWSDSFSIKPRPSVTSPGAKELTFDAHTSSIMSKEVAPLEEQEETETQRKWAKVTEALKVRDMDLATDEKTSIEDKQRADAKERETKEESWSPRFFELRDDQWHFKLKE
ncbi:hypothetical protein BJ684DRAFT_10098 [Piptocephalis cylindrospora]|uniref:Oxysterol-binding protein n=1 Tax=Piptocephalis cylindrospora TaxID=1907219 RepID=A0A4P9Y3X1_9FUNG|nr:hypothetical protein BJ684DRAFT_10098 [Piptocephalis cylindrospora]|eukprot:RKP13404.1 hypothetical protein BJ684DRAFT_10098 [Piptocephalis cylindrospora]